MWNVGIDPEGLFVMGLESGRIALKLSSRDSTFVPRTIRAYLGPEQVSFAIHVSCSKEADLI